MDKSNEELLAEFLAYERRRGGRAQWLRALPERVRLFFTYLEETGKEVSEVVRASDALAYQGWLLKRRTRKGKRYEKATVKTYLTAVTAFHEFLRRSAYLPGNPFREIRKVRPEAKLPRSIPREKELNAFLEALGRFDEGAGLKERLTRYRTHLVAELQYATGLRIGEAAGLRVEDVDLTRSLVEVREGKGGMSRVCFLSEYAREVLRLYIEKMRPLVFSEWNERHGRLLFGVSREVLIHVTNRTLKKAARSVGLENFTSHTFRHALGYHLLRAGCNIRHIQQILGHRCLRNTEIYTRVEKDELKEVVERCHPRGASARTTLSPRRP